MKSSFSFHYHLRSSEELVTSYQAICDGFVSLALEKNRKATPFVMEARALKIAVSEVKQPRDLLNIEAIRASLLTAAGISEKAAKHLTDDDRHQAILGLIEQFLEPAGKEFADELVYRFLLMKGDTFGRNMRNLGGILGERMVTRALISTLSLAGRPYSWLHSKTLRWIPKSADDSDIELQLRGLSWEAHGQPRTLIFNLTVPFINKNVDICLFQAAPDAINIGNKAMSAQNDPANYAALGELKGGIDPAGADEHWKTANSALERIRTAFVKFSMQPNTFFIGAAIAKSMAAEIFQQLEEQRMTNAANLTNEKQLFSLCSWLIEL